MFCLSCLKCRGDPRGRPTKLQKSYAHPMETSLLATLHKKGYTSSKVQQERGVELFQEAIVTGEYVPLDPQYEEKVRASFVRQAFMGFIGARLVDVRPGYCEIHVLYKRELTQQHGYFHAGVIGTLADNVGGYAAYTLMAADASVLTVEYKLNLLSPGEGELLIARGAVAKPGRTLTVCRSDVVVVKDGVERLCAIGVVTLMQMAGKMDTAG